MTPRRRFQLEGFAHHTVRVAVLAGLSCAFAGCGARVSTVAGYLTDPAQVQAWGALRPGERIVIFDPQGHCPAVVAPTVKDLDRSAKPISQQPWAGGAAIFTIRNSTIQPSSGDSRTSIVLELEGAKKDPLAMRWTPDGKASCVWPYSAAVEEALPWVGTTKVFAPWKPECTRIEAAGVSPDAVLIESEPGQTVKIEAVELASASASQLRSWAWQEPVVVWFKTNRGTLHLRGDTLQTCFADPDDPAASPPDGPMARIRTDPSRCSSEHVDGKKHVECATTLGVWEGVADQHTVSLRFVRRTLGSLHVVDGRPVKGDRFARTVVAVRMDAPSHDRERQLYASMQQAVGSVFSEDDGMVRVAPVGDPSVTLVVAAAVRGLQLGELEVREEKQQSEYEHHKETRPNPDKPKVMAAVETARGDLDQARKDFELRKEQERRDHETCMNGCDTLSDASSRNGCQIGCGVLSMVTAEDDSSVIAARAKLAEAQQLLAQTPDTVDVPVMAKWDYTKKIYARSISASLEMEIGFRSGPQRTSIPLSDAVTDYEVTEDPAHNVTGHSPNRDIIDRPESLLPLIAERLSIRLGKELRAAINQERQEAAIRAFAESGGEPSKPEYRAVDAMAFEAVGKRLRKALRRGLANPKPGDPASLPSAALEVGPKECLLAVAVSEGPASAEIQLATPDGSHADLRRKSFAVVELCGSELEANHPMANHPMANHPMANHPMANHPMANHPMSSTLVLSTSEAAPVRWGLYKVVIPDAGNQP